MREGPPDGSAGAPGIRASTVASRRVYSGRVLSLDVDEVRFPDGSAGSLELIRHPGAAAVVPVIGDPRAADAEVLLIRQFRYAADRFLYEVPAGRLEPGEPPVDCARRELLEEAGCTAAAIEPLGGFYTTPGFIDEYIHAFVATGLTRGAPAPERDEFITIEAHPLRRALAMIDRGEIVDGKTMIALLLLGRREHAPGVG
ncbi:MAG: NUDIX hydrolase [Gemmatimonadaceae bacterium]|nr:NUDIX hydrolase [Gemmatimonadaceae bacterium]